MRSLSLAISITAAVTTIATGLAAQSSPLDSQRRTLVIDSGVHDNTTDVERTAFQKLIHANLVPWMRVVFGETSLPGTSHIEIVSVKDGHRHALGAAELAEWTNHSAYFNGDMLLVRLIVAPRTKGARFKTSAIVVGLPVNFGPATQCGPTDDRVPTTDKRTGRLLPAGCTAWLISSLSCFSTAGHCRSTSQMTVQFNVPPSSSSGQIRHPGPQDQYPADMSTVLGNTGGVGNDWAIFKTNKNSTSGRHAGQVQGAFFKLGYAKPPISRTTRITGYGVDRDQRTRSQTNQTHAGPMQSTSGTRLCYRTDTEGGNSGSPVIDDVTGNAVGVHTHGGCTSSGGCNSGTSTTNTAYGTALRNMVCDPPLCANPANFTTYGVSCQTASQGCKLLFSQNWQQKQNNTTTTANQIAIMEFNRPLANICAVDFYTKSRSGNVTVTVGIAKLSPITGKPDKLLTSGTVTVGTTAKTYQAKMPTLKIKQSDIFLIVFDNADKLVLSTVSTGNQTYHYARNGNNWSDLQTNLKWQYRVHSDSGAQAPVLTHTDKPVLGDAFTINLTQAPSARAAVLLFGFSNKNWGNLPLPFDLKSIGAPGCHLLASGDVLFTVVTDNNGAAGKKFALPKDKNLCNAHSYFQYMVLDVAANKLGLVFTNAGDANYGS
ncbi:MAG: hypothetical protein CMJ85_10840 [Planctomycetes bacterium]|nr:hypothetical protein [Planctomycetota bacterium]